jgi:hypothetical protein
MIAALKNVRENRRATGGHFYPHPNKAISLRCREHCIKIIGLNFNLLFCFAFLLLCLPASLLFCVSLLFRFSSLPCSSLLSSICFSHTNRKKLINNTL